MGAAAPILTRCHYVTTFSPPLRLDTVHPFQYLAPTTVKDVVSALNKYGDRARVLAGGTDVLPQVRGGRFELDALVDVKGVPELMELRIAADGLHLGAAVPCYQVYENQPIAKAYPGIVDSASLIGGIQIQSRASLGGNLCNASPSADSICSLIVHDAVAHIARPRGTREVPVAGFCTGPGSNALKKGEFLVSIFIPRPAARFGAAYQRFIPRNEMDIAVVGVAAAVTLNAEGKITAARVALAAAGPTPIVASKAAAALLDREPTEEAFREAGDIAATEAKPIDDMRGTAEHRRELVRVLTRRTLAVAASRANGANQA
jgi:carbon-monoxide dehydrogenase medium subunit